jgi:hypothetical protein
VQNHDHDTTARQDRCAAVFNDGAVEDDTTTTTEHTQSDDTSRERQQCRDDTPSRQMKGSSGIS